MLNALPPELGEVLCGAPRPLGVAGMLTLRAATPRARLERPLRDDAATLRALGWDAEAGPARFEACQRALFPARKPKELLASAADGFPLPYAADGGGRIQPL